MGRGRKDWDGRKRPKTGTADHPRSCAGAETDQHDNVTLGDAPPAASSALADGGASSAKECDGYAFVPDPNDHCETSPAAYGHIAPLLRLLALQLGKKPSDLAIYDPYFCAGSVVRHLAGLGFTNVHNKNEDFYAVSSAGTVPAHDVVVTNPPYTGDHVERLLAFLATNGKPLCILMPNYFGDDGTGTGQGKGTTRQRANYAAWMQGRKPIFLCPKERYQYWTPRNIKADSNLHRGHKTVPFVSYWHIVLTPVLDHQQLCNEWHRRPSRNESEEVDDADEYYYPDNVATVAPAPAASVSMLLSHTSLNREANVLARSATYAELPKLQLPSDCGLFDAVAKVASSGWGRGGWPHRGAWVSKKKRRAGFS